MLPAGAQFPRWSGLWLVGAVALLVTPLPGQTPGSGEASLREGYADVPGARIFYRDAGGSGVPVVFLHAATGSSRVWQYQIPVFTAAKYRFIAYDRRGWGRTTVDPAGPQPGT